MMERLTADVCAELPSARREGVLNHSRPACRSNSARCCSSVKCSKQLIWNFKKNSGSVQPLKLSENISGRDRAVLFNICIPNYGLPYTDGFPLGKCHLFTHTRNDNINASLSTKLANADATWHSATMALFMPTFKLLTKYRPISVK